MVGGGPGGRARSHRVRVRFAGPGPAPGPEQGRIGRFQLAPFALPVLPGQIHLGRGGGYMGVQGPGRTGRREAVTGREESLLRYALAQLGAGHA